jgi:prepilin-type N-terminal cleavage/methylation domain-containing protein
MASLNRSTYSGWERRSAGFSLVELMVASSILGLAVTGVMAMLGTARSVEAESGLRQQATYFAVSALDDTNFHYTKYPLATAAIAPRIDTLRFSTGDTIQAVESRTVSAVDNSVTWYDYKNPAIANVIVPFQRVTVKVKWSLLGQADSVVLTKRVAQVAQ